MNENERKEGIYIRSLGSEEAANYLLEKYYFGNLEPANIFKIIPQRSWKRPDQIKLCKYYMQNIPYANSIAYETFASFMSIKLLVRIIRDIPIDASKADLLLYYLPHSLRKYARTEEDRIEISSLIECYENMK